MNFPIGQTQIFAATNGGLDIIQRFLQFKNVNKHFKIRKEGTESAFISQKMFGNLIKEKKLTSILENYKKSLMMVNNDK